LENSLLPKDANRLLEAQATSSIFPLFDLLVGQQLEIPESKHHFATHGILPVIAHGPATIWQSPPIPLTCIIAPTCLGGLMRHQSGSQPSTKPRCAGGLMRHKVAFTGEEHQESPMARSQPHTHVQPGMSTHGSLWLHVAAEGAIKSQPMVNDHSPPQVATLADLGCTWFYFLANFKASHRCVDADYRSFKKIQWGFAFVFSHFKHAYRISDAD